MEPIAATKCDFYIKENAVENHTIEYDLVYFEDQPTPIFRRGCRFHFVVRFDRPLDIERDVIRIKFSIGKKPSQSKETLAIIKVDTTKRQLMNEDPYAWEICISDDVNRRTGNGVNDIVFQVYIPANAPVGIWKCSIETNIKGIGKNKKLYQCDEDIYIIFNPWCKNDTVYMENEEDLKEYILNENGKIWCGTFKEPKSKKWIFGQFDNVVLPAAVFFLERTGLSHSLRGSPVFVTRAISQAINSADNTKGVLEGNWSGNYEGGTSPLAWTGSVAIMDQYLRSRGTPVKYGQCWVFSAVVVTVCRALGIPCRSVTNYVSAHDTDSSLTIDTYFDIHGDKIRDGLEGCNDSCWNFHVWNDVWMSRPDLPEGFGGWQVIDATPQEMSDDAFRCGPASVEAVRRGEVSYLYDTPFVYAEVNADICHFQEDEESDWGFRKLRINKYHVGRKILTKRVGLDDDRGDSDMWDVTDFYKNPEGSEEERRSVYRAIRGFPRAKRLYEDFDKNDDVFFNLIDIDTIPLGQLFEVVVHIQNRSNEERNVKAVLSASSVYYNGNVANEIVKLPGEFRLRPGQLETLKVSVTPEEYFDKLVEHSMVKIYAIANVAETTQAWSEEDDFVFTKPEIEVWLGERGKVGEESIARFRFQNPLEIPCTGCVFSVEGPGFTGPKVLEFRDIMPFEIVEFEESFQPNRAGMKKIVATFTSNELNGIGGSANMFVD